MSSEIITQLLDTVQELIDRLRQAGYDTRNLRQTVPLCERASTPAEVITIEDSDVSTTGESPVRNNGIQSTPPSHSSVNVDNIHSTPAAGASGMQNHRRNTRSRSPYQIRYSWSRSPSSRRCKRSRSSCRRRYSSSATNICRHMSCETCLHAWLNTGGRSGCSLCRQESPAVYGW
ncbi:hypothetical protein Bhyg_04242, partial [Pseudolycoriella hygida]